MKQLALSLILALLLTALSGCVQPGTQPKLSEPAGTTPTGAAPAASETDAEVHPMLFHVTGPEGQEGWLFGTIHVGDQRIDTALGKLKPVLNGCDALAVEFDVVAYEKDYGAQLRAMGHFLLRDGTKISDHMPAETYEKAAALLREAGLSSMLTDSYNLAMWSQLVSQAAILTRTDYDMEFSMDRSLIRYCYEKKIEVRDVESAEFQYALLASFSDELNLLLIDSTLNGLDTYGAGVDALYGAWLSGDYDRIVGVLNEESGGSGDLTEEQAALLEDYYDQMLARRNLSMSDKAVAWLEAGDQVFFAVGAAHLVDEGGLVELLRAGGYTVEQVDY